MLLEVASHFEQENSFSWQSNSLILLANLYQARGDHHKAEEFIARAIAIDRRIYAPNNYTLLSHSVTQGLILIRAGKIKQGEKIMREALRQMNDEQRKGFDANLGELLFAQKRYTEAEPLLLDSYRTLKETQHPARPRLKKAQEQLQKLYAERQK